jgi:ERF superfamily
MQTSEQINELATALAKAQGEITGALKDSLNPAFKRPGQDGSKYADLASCWDACRAPLSKNGLSVVQGTQVTDGNLYLMTRLLHSSGQWMGSMTPVTPKDDSPQGMGSALTYARRYALTAMVGIAQIDDDGNAASGRHVPVAEIHSPKGDAVQSVPQDVARSHATKMLAIITTPAKDGDHDELGKALEAYDYHTKYLATNHDLYIAAAEQMDAAKRNVWKALINKAKASEAADKIVANAGRKF